MKALLRHIQPLRAALKGSLPVFFLVCHVLGVMCAVPDLVGAADQVVISEATMACPMGGGPTCAPLLVSSQDRDPKGQRVLADDHVGVNVPPPMVGAAPIGTVPVGCGPFPLLLPPTSAREVLRI